MNHQHSETAAPGVANRGDDKGKQREEPIRTSTPDELSSPAELDSDANLALWTSVFRRKKDCKKTPSRSFPEVMEVYAKRVPKASFSPLCLCLCSDQIRTHQGHAVLEQKKSVTLVFGSSSQGPTVHTQTFSGGQAGPSSQPIAGHVQQVTGVNPTNDDTDSDWVIEGCCNICLDKICYPFGH